MNPVLVNYAFPGRNAIAAKNLLAVTLWRPYSRQALSRRPILKGPARQRPGPFFGDHLKFGEPPILEGFCDQQ